MKKTFAVVTVLFLCSLSFAQLHLAPKANPQGKAQAEAAAQMKKNAAQNIVRSIQSSTTCAFTFTSGTNNTSLKYCVTSNGNIVQFESPIGVPLVSQSGFGDGYGVCDFNTGISYFDFGGRGDSGNWNPATVVSHNNSSVKIARTTSDGLWTLTQTISQVAGNSPAAKVTFTLKNNSGISKVPLFLRYTDLDAAGDTSNNFDGTLNSGFGWNSNEVSSSGPFGLMLQNTGNPKVLAFLGYAQNIFDPPDPCNPTANITVGPQIAIDGSLVVAYESEVPKFGTMTGTLVYKGF